MAFEAPAVLMPSRPPSQHADSRRDEEDLEAEQPPALAPIAPPAAAPANVEAEKSEQVLEDELRVRARDTLVRASLSKDLEEALVEVREERPTAGAGPSTPTPKPAKETPTPQAPVKNNLECIGTKPALAWALQAVSQRDKRAGELLAMINEAQRKLCDREETCQQIEERIGSARLDLAHLELDIEWHRRSHEAAKERSCELEAGQYKLLGELDGENQKLRHANIEAQESCLMSARSEMSTATGGATASSIGCFTPLNAHNSLPLSPSPLYSTR